MCVCAPYLRLHVNVSAYSCVVLCRVHMPKEIYFRVHLCWLLCVFFFFLYESYGYNVMEYNLSNEFYIHSVLCCFFFCFPFSFIFFVVVAAVAAVVVIIIIVAVAVCI